MSEKYSGDWKLNASWASGGASVATRTIATQAPKNDATVVITSAVPARPCRAIG